MYTGKLFWKTQPDSYYPNMFRGIVTKEDGEIVAMTAFAHSREESALAAIKKRKIVRNNIR